METNKPTIVIAGAAHLTKRPADRPLNVVEMMCEVIQSAAEDSGSDTILSAIDQIIIPKGTWNIDNPGELVAQNLGLRTRNITYDLGILQSSLIKRAIQDVSESKSRCTVVVGGETKNFERNASGQLNSFPDFLDPKSEDSSVTITAPELPISRYEIDMGLVRASDQYALLENSYANAHKLNPEQHQHLINNEWEQMAKIAETNPAAWVPKAQIFLENNGWGRSIATPYKLHHVTQWNVNQAAAIIITTADVAQSFTGTSDTCVYPDVLIESNAVIPVLERKHLHQCIGLEEIDSEFFRLTKRRPSESQFHELYSCFPIAIRLQQEAYGLSNKPVSLTGGMTFAGGPFNNFTLQGLSQLTKQVRITDTTGIITSISGMLTKQGLISLSSQEPPSEIHISDITDTTRSKTETVEIQPNVTGEVEIISSTVSFNAGNAKAYVLVENRNGQRRLLVSKKEGLIDHFLNMHRIEDRISISKNGEMTI